MIALAWRRRASLVVAAIVVRSNIISNPQGEFTTLLSLVLVSFTVGAENDPPWSYLGLGLVFIPFLVVSIIESFEPSDLAAGLVFFVGPWAVGVITRGRIASAEEAVARAEQLERNRELEAAKAAAEERTRIARELHDIVSHSISVVTIQTQAVRRRLGPEHAAEARRPRRRRGDRPRGAGRDAPALRRAAHRGRPAAGALAAAGSLRARPAGAPGGVR